MLAAYWIQFMTHDWFSHMEEGHNAAGVYGGRLHDAAGEQRRDAADAGGDSEAGMPARRPRGQNAMCCRTRRRANFTSGGKQYLTRAPKTFANNNTAWWDASQIYGYDETSVKRVKRDPKDPAKLLLEPVTGVGGGYLPVLSAERSRSAAVGGAGVGGVSRQLVHRAEFLSQPVRAGAQLVCGRISQAGGDETRTTDSGLRNPSRPEARDPLTRT